MSTEQHSSITEEELPERFGIGIHMTRETLQTAFKWGTWSVILTLGWQYQSDQIFEEQNLQGRFLLILLISNVNPYVKIFEVKCTIIDQDLQHVIIYLKPTMKNWTDVECIHLKI